MAQGPIIPCTTTLTKFPQFNLDPTTTVYLSTETETSSVDCGGCSVVAVTTRYLGPGPVCLAFPSYIRLLNPQKTSYNFTLRSAKMIKDDINILIS